MKLIYVYSKKGRLRFVSHLELQRFLLRALNRTDLPITFSQGFNPHPLLSIAGALAMGYESDYEVFEVRVDGEVQREHALQTMQSALPQEMHVLDVVSRPDNHPAMMSLVQMADYEIVPLQDQEALNAAAEAFWSMDSCMGIRKTKSGEREVDVRQLCKGLKAENGLLRARLMLTERDTLKPDLLMATLCKLAGIEVPPLRVCRKGLLGADAQGQMQLIHLL